MVHQSYHVGRQFPSWALDPREVKTWPCKKECVNVQRGAIANSQSVGARTPVGEEGKQTAVQPRTGVLLIRRERGRAAAGAARTNSENRAQGEKPVTGDRIALVPSYEMSRMGKSEDGKEHSGCLGLVGGREATGWQLEGGGLLSGLDEEVSKPDRVTDAHLLTTLKAFALYT